MNMFVTSLFSFSLFWGGKDGKKKNHSLNGNHRKSFENVGFDTFSQMYT